MRPKAQPDESAPSTSAATPAAALQAAMPTQPALPSNDALPTAAAHAVAPAAPPESAAVASGVPDVPSAAPSETSELIVVTVNTVPADARFFHKGKPVGRAPLRVELKPGERRSFEIGHPGYYARKVVVDGKKKEMTVTMRPDH
ncbi:MAG TPA: PEGA domain-containing protein [Polyangiaceae bacterium]